MGSYTLIATFALLVGAAVASIGFKEGHEYEYKYYGKAVSGIPDIKNQFAGVILRGDVKFQRLNNQQVLMRIERLQAIELNGPVPTGPTEKVLRDLQKEAPETIQQTVDLTQLAPALRHVVKIQYENGKIHNFEVSRDVPEWALNIQKGIMSMIKLKLDESLAMGKAEQMNQISKQYNQDVFLNYNVMEEDCVGMCESTYMIRSQPWEANPTEQVLNVTKLRNLNKCNDFHQYTFQTLQDQDCPNCEAGKQDIYSHVASMEYSLRGNRHSFEIERVESYAQMLFTPYTANADSFLTNTSRVLVLRNKQPVQTPLTHEQQHSSSNYKTHQSLQFRLPSAHDQQSNGEERMQSGAQFDLRKAPITPYHAHHEQGQQQQEQAMRKVQPEQVQRLIEEIAREIHQIEKEENTEVLAKALKAKKLMRMLNYDEINRVYEECKRIDTVCKHVCEDIMVMCGTAPAIMCLKKNIETEQIRGERAALILQQIPTTIYNPHYTLIEEFKQLTKCEAAKRDSQIYSTAWLSFGTLVSVACNGTGNTRETPSHIPKNFYCPTEMKQRFMNELAQELRTVREHWRQTVLIHAIGNTLAPEAVEILMPYLSGEVTNCPVLRSKAIHACNGAAKVRPHKTLKALAPIFFNVDEVAEVRAAALSVMISCHPSNQFLSKIAASTWTEQSQQIGSLVCSTLKSLAEADQPCLKDLQKDAVQAYQLCNKDFEGNLLDSKNMIFDDDKMAQYNMFNTLQSYWIRSNESIIPTQFLAKLNQTIAGYNFNLFQAQLNQKGLDEVLNRVFGPKSAFFNLRSTADLFRSEKEESHKGFRQLIESLNIDTEDRETSDVLFNLYFKLYDTQARNFHLTKQTIKNFITGNSNNDLSKQLHQLVFGNGLNLNLHKIFNTHERIVQFASPLGLPIVMQTNEPVYMGVKGHINVDVDASRNPNSVVPTNVRLSANVRPIVIKKKLMTMGVILPFEQKRAVAGVNHKTIVSLPIKGQINIDLSEMKVTVNAGRTNDQQQRQNENANRLPLFSYKVKPFTCVEKTMEAKPVTHQQNVKAIQTLRRPKQAERVFLAKTLGLPIVLKAVHEHELSSKASYINQILDNGLWNTLNFWRLPQTFKHAEYTVRAHQDNAETREIQAVFDFDFTNSQLQQALRDGQYTPNQIWAKLTGWSDIPMPCKPASELNRNQYENEDKCSGVYCNDESNEYNGESNWENNSWEQNSENVNEQCEQECGMDKQCKHECQQAKNNNNNNQGYSTSNKRNFWKNWEAQRESSNEQSSEEKYESRENTGNWFSNFRQSRRHSPLASRLIRKQQNQQQRAYGEDLSSDYEWTSAKYNDREQLNNAEVRRAHFAEHVPAWKLLVKINTIGGQERSVVAVFTGKRNFDQLQDSIKAEIKIQNPHLQGNQIDMCAEAVAQYPAIPCSYDNSFHPNSVGPIVFQAKSSWGTNGCSASNNFVEVSAKVGKSYKQIQYEQEAKPWYYKQCAEERKKGLKFEEACSKLYDEITALNKIDMKIKYNNLPLALKNATHKVDNFVKAMFYTHMSNDAVTGHNQEKQVRIVVEFQPNKNAVDVKIEKPTETTILKEIETTIEAPSAHRTVAQQVADALTGRQLPATCDISNGKYVDTFNNVTYKHEMGQCTYLAARDCSPNGLFAVLVSGPQAQKSGAANGVYCEVQLLKNTIKLAPLTASMTKYQVAINGEHRELNQGETIIVESGKQAAGTPEPLAYITLSGQFVHVKAPAHGVEIKYDGKDVRVQTSYFYAGKMCGLCGNFDGESKDEFVGPKGCIYAQAKHFAESYIVNDGECQQRKHQAQRSCEKKDSTQESKAVYPQLKSQYSGSYMNKNFEDESSTNYDRDFNTKQSRLNTFSNENNDDEDQVAQRNQRRHGNRYESSAEQFELRNQRNNDYERLNTKNNNDEDETEDQSFWGKQGRKQSGEYENDWELTGNRRQNDESCTVYRNKITYGKQSQHNQGRLANLYSRLSSFAARSSDEDQTNSDEIVDSLIKTNENQICFSVEPVRQCRAECRAEQEQTRSVGYHCMDSESYEAKQLLRQQPNQRLNQLSGKTVHVTKDEYVPTYCKAY